MIKIYNINYILFLILYIVSSQSLIFSIQKNIIQRHFSNLCTLNFFFFFLSCKSSLLIRMRPADKASAAVPSRSTVELKDQSKPNSPSSSSGGQATTCPRSVDSSGREMRSKDVIKGSEDSLRMMVFLGSWGPN